MSSLGLETQTVSLDHMYSPMLVIDLTSLWNRQLQLRKSFDNSADFESHLRSRPVVIQLLDEMEVSEVNIAAVRAFGADSKRQLSDGFFDTIVADSVPVIGELLVDVASNTTSAEYEFVHRSFTEERLHCRAQCSFVQSDEPPLLVE